VREEAADVRFRKLRRVALVVEEDILFDPLQVSLFGTYAVGFSSYKVTDLFQEFGHIESG
jgi:hypothetical protein